MKLLVVGGGGREHAIIRKLLESPKVEKIYCAPGNGGISCDAQCVDINAMDKDSMVTFAKQNGIDFAVVAPDDPLAAGMVDAMEEAGIPMASAEVTMIPQTYVELTDAKDIANIQKTLDMLDDDDDVQDVYHNWDE